MNKILQIRYHKDHKIFFHIILLIFYQTLNFHIIKVIENISMILFDPIFEQLLELIQGHSNHIYWLNPKEIRYQIFIVLFDLFCLVWH